MKKLFVSICALTLLLSCNKSAKSSEDKSSDKKFENYKNALDFYKVLDSKYEYFSEQTIINILLKDNSFMPLTPKTFILDTDDQFDFSYLYNPKQMAVRHYTGPVRHKMWQKGYKWHLGL